MEEQNKEISENQEPKEVKEKAPDTKKPMPKIAIIIGAAVAVVAIAVVLIVLLGGNKSDNFGNNANNNNPNDQVTPSHTHNFGEWKTVKAATCTAEGSEESVCPCGKKQIRSISAIGHTFGEWKTVKVATCTTEGIEARYCVCGEKQENTLVTIPHIPTTIPEVKPTCIETGLTEGSACSVCNTILVGQTTVPVTKHSFGEATCTQPSTCITCGETTGTTLPHNISILDGKCVTCEKFEYNNKATARYAAQMMLGWINYAYDFDSYEVLNIYYILHDECVCDDCRKGDYVGDPYMTVVLFFEYTLYSETDVHLELVAVHKTGDSISPYHLSVLSQNWCIKYINDTITKLYADDYSYYYEESDLILASKSEML